MYERLPDGKSAGDARVVPATAREAGAPKQRGGGAEREQPAHAFDRDDTLAAYLRVGAKGQWRRSAVDYVKYLAPVVWSAAFPLYGSASSHRLYFDGCTATTIFSTVDVPLNYTECVRCAGRPWIEGNIETLAIGEDAGTNWARAIAAGALFTLYTLSFVYSMLLFRHLSRRAFAHGVVLRGGARADSTAKMAFMMTVYLVAMNYFLVTAETEGLTRAVLSYNCDVPGFVLPARVVGHFDPSNPTATAASSWVDVARTSVIASGPLIVSIASLLGNFRQGLSVNPSHLLKSRSRVQAVASRVSHTMLLDDLAAFAKRAKTLRGGCAGVAARMTRASPALFLGTSAWAPTDAEFAAELNRLLAAGVVRPLLP